MRPPRRPCRERSTCAEPRRDRSARAPGPRPPPRSRPGTRARPGSPPGQHPAKWPQSGRAASGRRAREGPGVGDGRARLLRGAVRGVGRPRRRRLRSMSDESSLTGVLRRHGYRVTPPRRRVWQVLAGGDHLTAEEIAGRIADQQGSEVNLASVYRALALMEELDLVRSSRFGGAGADDVGVGPSGRALPPRVSGVRPSGAPSRHAGRPGRHAPPGGPRVRARGHRAGRDGQVLELRRSMTRRGDGRWA